MGNEVNDKKIRNTVDVVNNKKEHNRGRIKARKLYLDKYREIDEDIDVIKDEEVKEELLDKELEKDDNMSIALITLILVSCFVVGIVVGYFMYRIVIK